MDNQLITRIKERMGNAWIISLIYNVTFVLGVLLFCRVSYETNDDNAMANIAYGATGEYGMVLMYINTFVGVILKALLSIFPTIPWYPIMMYICMFLGFTVITFILLEKNRFWGTIVSWVLLIFYGYNFYTLLQFTKVPSVITVAGILLLFHTMEKEKFDWKLIIFAVVLIMFGAAYRFNTFGMMFFLMIGYGVSFVYKAWKNREFKKIYNTICMFLVAIVICFSMKIVNSRLYDLQEDWSYFKEFNSNRAALLDYGFPPYEDNLEIYQSVNISKEDLQFYKTWNFADPDKFNVETVKALVQEKPTQEITSEFLTEFIKWFPIAFLKYDWIVGFLIILVATIVLQKKNYKWIIYDFVVLLVLQFYLYYTGRYLLNRVDVCIFFALTVILSIKAVESAPIVNESNKNRIKYVAILMMVSVLLPQWYEDNSKTIDEEMKANAIEMSNLVMHDKEHLYISPVGGKGLWKAAYGIWDLIPKGAKSNCYSLGGWQTYAPFTECVKDAYGIENPFADGIDNENVYYMAETSKMESICSYIQRNYNPNAQVITRKDINGYILYNVVSHSPMIDMNKVQEELDNIQSNFEIKYNGSLLELNGYAYLKGKSSYAGRCYLQATTVDGNVTAYDIIQYENEIFYGDKNGQFSKYQGAWAFYPGTISEISIYYELEDKLYCIKKESLQN